MKKENWQEIERLLETIYDLEPNRKQEFINKINPSELREEIISLLKYEKTSEKFLETSALKISAVIFERREENTPLVGKIIGNYEVCGEINRGGMGTVYLATRTDGEFEQKVALKLLRREFNITDLRNSFIREKQILASLKHPNIALLLDSGTTEDGIPYMVMEYVKGNPIDQFFQEKNLTLREKLGLFEKICQAVSFAHRNLVIHRDLKCSNMLVTDNGIPKLLDFGIAKLLKSDYEDKDLHTVTKLGVMTPEYASPEQLRGESVTTATDIYSLGVVLFELLTGQKPFIGNSLEIIKERSEREPNLPSFVVKNSKERSNKRNTVRSAFLKGDLDNIILKALKTDPERRYSTADQFAEDIRRYLTGLPILARPDSFTYRTTKFIQRHRFGVFAGILMFLLLLGGIFTTLWQSKVAETERDRARSETRKAEKINEFLQNVLNFSNPNWTSSNPERNRRATISEAVDDAAKRVETELGNEPGIQAEVHLTLGKSYFGLGRYNEAEKQFEKSLKKFNEELGTEHWKTLQATLGLADTLQLKGEFNRAEPLYRKILPVYREMVKEDITQKKWYAAALNDLGLLLNHQGRIAEAESLFNESLIQSKELFGQDRSVLPIALGNLGIVYRNRGDLKSALEHFQNARKELKKLSDKDSFEDGVLLNNIGLSLKMSGELHDAKRHLIKSEEVFQNTVGDKHQFSVYPVIQLADVYYLEGDYDKALEKINKALDVQQELFPKGHLDIAYSKNILGKILTKTGKVKKGEMYLLEAIKIREKVLKEPHFLLGEANLALGDNLLEQKRFEEARETLIKAKKNFILTVGENHPYTNICSKLLMKFPD